MADPHQINQLLAIRADTLKAMHALNGTRWEEASGELHYQYKEMPNWIRLAFVEHLRPAHASFLQIFTPHFVRLGDVNLTVSYSVGRTLIVFLSSNDEIRDALNTPDFGYVAPK
jgi:hypothetical protein